MIVTTMLFRSAIIAPGPILELLYIVLVGLSTNKGESLLPCSYGTNSYTRGYTFPVKVANGIFQEKNCPPEKFYPI